MSEFVDLHGMLYALKERIKAESYNDYQVRQAFRQIASLQDKAIAYVWGREDGGEIKISEVYGREIIDASMEFGNMIAIMVAASHLGDYSMSHAPNLRHSFAAFRASRDLREYVHEGK